MKRIVAITLSLILFASFTITAVAEEEKPILFRSVPYGSNIPSVLKILSDISFSSPSTDYGCDVDYYIYGDGDIKYKDHVCLKMSSRNSDIKVAGYPISSVRLFFTYTPDETGILPKDEEHTAFLMGEYSIKPKDLGFAMDDLLQKLTSLYGESEYHKSGRVITYESYVWRGAEGTIVSLLSEVYSSGSEELYIRYTFDGLDDNFQTAIDALILEEVLKTDKNDTSGL